MNENTELFDDALDEVWTEDTHEDQDAQPDADLQEPDQPREEGQEQEEAPLQETPPELFVLQRMGETRQVGRDEMIALAQKGWDYDSVRQERDQLRQYRQEADPALGLVRGYAQRSGMSVEQYIDHCRAQELMGQGVGQETAQAQARVERMQAQQEARDREAQAAQQRQREIFQQAQRRQEERRRDMGAFLQAYPGVRGEDIPQEVWARVAGGESLVTAYTMLQNQQLQAQIQAERQNRANAQAAIGSLGGQGGNAQTELDRVWYNDDD